jgi:EmrB/QacA subfamily drug resistance transporter
VFLLVILTAQMMVVLDTTIVNVALPHIQRSLRLGGGGLSWVINAYILTFGGLLLLGARAGDLLGRRRVFLVGIAVFSVSSLLGGLAVSGWMLLAARAAQGVGGALAAPTALSLLTTVFPEGPRRVRAIALYTTVSAAGGAIGLVAGGLLTELLSWRWVMFVNVPIGLGVFLLGRLVLVETERRRGRFDVLGALTSTLGMGAVVLGLVEAGQRGWTAPVTLGSFVIGLGLLAVFVVNERTVDEPILPLGLLADATRSTANASRGLVYAGMYGMFFFLSLFFQDVQHYAPLRAGIAFLPIPASVFLASQLASRVLAGRVPQKAVMLSGISLVTASLLLGTRLSAASSYVEIVGSLALLGAGSGLCFVSLTTASLAGVDPADAGAASGLINVSQQLGAALGLAVLVTVFGVATSHAQISGAAGVHGGPARHTDAVLVHGLHVVFGVGVLFALAALVAVAVFVRTPGETPAAVVEPAEADDEAEPDKRDSTEARSEADDDHGRTDEWDGAVPPRHRIPQGV